MAQGRRTSLSLSSVGFGRLVVGPGSREASSEGRGGGQKMRSASCGTPAAGGRAMPLLGSPKESGYKL